MQPLTLPLIPSEPHPCMYLPSSTARLVLTFGAEITATVYQQLMDRGFRRNGLIFYRPDCQGCAACVPLRVPVARFAPSRSQRRVARRNRDLRIEIAAPRLDLRRLTLFREYQHFAHDDLEEIDEERYVRLFCDSTVDSLEMSYWLEDRLLGVGLVDVTPRCLSSVYFYYDPAESWRSLGIFSGLAEIEECARRGLPYWYLGYWVRGCRKMDYKGTFRPYELLEPDGIWREPGPSRLEDLSGN